VAHVGSVNSPDEIVPKRVLGTGDTSLDALMADAETRRTVGRILTNMEEPSRLPVAAFNSAI
jgi:FXSXX-COOH protein